MDESVQGDISTLERFEKERHILESHAQILSAIVIRYFGVHKRNQAFQKIEPKISKRFEVLAPTNDSEISNRDNKKINPFPLT